MQHYADIYLLQNHSTCFGCTAPIIRSTKNCNRSLRYRSLISVQLLPSNVALSGHVCPIFNNTHK